MNVTEYHCGDCGRIWTSRRGQLNEEQPCGNCGLYTLPQRIKKPGVQANHGRGAAPLFAKFFCGCGNDWGSKYAKPNKRQQCRGCGTSVMPDIPGQPRSQQDSRNFFDADDRSDKPEFENPFTSEYEQDCEHPYTRYNDLYSAYLRPTTANPFQRCNTQAAGDKESTKTSNTYKQESATTSSAETGNYSYDPWAELAESLNLTIESLLKAAGLNSQQKSNSPTSSTKQNETKSRFTSASGNASKTQQNSTRKSAQKSTQNCTQNSTQNSSQTANATKKYSASKGKTNLSNEDFHLFDPYFRNARSSTSSGEFISGTKNEQDAKTKTAPTTANNSTSSNENSSCSNKPTWNSTSSPNNTKSAPKPETFRTPSSDPKASSSSKYSANAVQQHNASGKINFDKYKTESIAFKKKLSLRNAIDCFQQATKACAITEHVLLCPTYKNLSTCYDRLAGLEGCYSLKADNLLESCRYRADAIFHGEKANKDKEWLDQMLELLDTSLEDLHKDGDTLGRILNAIERDIQALEYHDIMINYRQEQTQQYIESVMVSLKRKDHKIALSVIRKAHIPLEEVKKHISIKKLATITTDVNIKEQMKETYILEKEVTCLEVKSEALQSYNMGVQYFEKAKLASTEAGNFGTLAIDSFKQVTQTLKREDDAELVAMTHTKIGLVYLNVLKRTSKARTSFAEAMKALDILSPNSYQSEIWYKELKDTLERIRIDSTCQSKKWDEKRQSILEKMKPELDILRTKKRSSTKSLIEFLFDKYPPRHSGGSDQKPSVEEIESKKIWLKLIRLYHPDKIDREKFDDKYFVICEEITKILTARDRN